MAQLSMELEVVGPNRGKSFTFRNYTFENGRIKIVGQVEAVMGSCLYLERTQQAYPVGSTELREAIERIHGKREVQPSTGSGDSAEVPSGLPTVPEPPAAPAPAELQRTDNPPAGAARVLPRGDRSGRTASGAGPALVPAVKK